MQKTFNLVFDATILANGINKNHNRGGIFFTVYNIFKELLKHDNIKLTLYCIPRTYRNLLVFLKENFPDKNFDILTQYSYLTYINLKDKKKEFKNKGFLKKFLLQMAICLYSPISKIICKIETKTKIIPEINKNDAYLSLVYKKPIGTKIKSYTMLHDLIPLLFKDYSNSWKKGKWLYDLCKTLNKKDYYFTNSDCTKKDFLKYYPQIDPNKIKTTYLACDEKFYPRSEDETKKAKEKYNIPKDKKYVFSLCTLEPRKNNIRAVKTFIEFIKKHNIDDLVFVIGGGQWEAFISKLENEIENLKEYKNKIIKTGYVDDEDLPALYSGAMWFCYTSMYEGFGLPPLEAMSSGCPVITSNNSSLPEVVGNSGIMIDYDNDEAHIKAYEDYYFNEELRKKYSKMGPERAKEFSWKKCADEIVNTILSNQSAK